MWCAFAVALLAPFSSGTPPDAEGSGGGTGLEWAELLLRGRVKESRTWKNDDTMPGSLLSAKSGRGVAVPAGGVEAPEAMFSCSSSAWFLLWEWGASAGGIMGVGQPCGAQRSQEENNRDGMLSRGDRCKYQDRCSEEMVQG